MTPKPHQRPCANCQHTGPLPDGWRWCCWFPIGCQCAVTPKYLHPDKAKGASK